VRAKRKGNGEGEEGGLRRAAGIVSRAKQEEGEGEVSKWRYLRRFTCADRKAREQNRIVCTALSKKLKKS